jgi:hypothetical protein
MRRRRSRKRRRSRAWSKSHFRLSLHLRQLDTLRGTWKTEKVYQL